MTMTSRAVCRKFCFGGGAADLLIGMLECSIAGLLERRIESQSSNPAIEQSSNLRDWVVTSGVEGVAPTDAEEAHPRTFDQTVPFYGFESVLAAARRKTARVRHPRETALITAD